MEVLRGEVTAAEYDCLASLLAGAATSYRKASTLNPFPKGFLRNTKDRDYDRLAACLATLPTPEDMFGPEPPARALTPDHDSLLQFLASDVVRVRRVDVATLRPHFPMTVASLTPNFAFALQHPPDTAAAQEFEALRRDHGSLVAFHGSPVENWHCIANTGLRNFSGTTRQQTGALFGEGIYLSTSLALGMDFSRTGDGWVNSTILGRRLRIIGLCEVIKHPTAVQRKDDGPTQRGETQSVPNAYIVAESSACVRVTHLLVYTDATPKPGGATPTSGRSMYLIFFYVSVLASVFMSRAENQASLAYHARKAARTLRRL